MQQGSLGNFQLRILNQQIQLKDQVAEIQWLKKNFLMNQYGYFITIVIAKSSSE